MYFTLLVNLTWIFFWMLYEHKFCNLSDFVLVCVVYELCCLIGFISCILWGSKQLMCFCIDGKGYWCVEQKIDPFWPRDPSTFYIQYLDESILSCPRKCSLSQFIKLMEFNFLAKFCSWAHLFYANRTSIFLH